MPSIVNAVILLSSFSAGNSYLYAASRTLYGLSCDKQAPAFFSRVTKGGLPIFCVAITVAFGALAFMNVSTNGEVVFNCELLIRQVSKALLILFCKSRVLHAFIYHWWI